MNSQENNLLNLLQCKDGARAIWQNLVEVFQLFYSNSKELYQICRAPFINETILELSDIIASYIM